MRAGYHPVNVETIDILEFPSRRLRFLRVTLRLAASLSGAKETYPKVARVAFLSPGFLMPLLLSRLTNSLLLPFNFSAGALHGWYMRRVSSVFNCRKLFDSNCLRSADSDTFKASFAYQWKNICSLAYSPTQSCPLTRGQEYFIHRQICSVQVSIASSMLISLRQIDWWSNSSRWNTLTVVPFDKPPVDKLDLQLTIGICVHGDGGTGVKLKISILLIA